MNLLQISWSNLRAKPLSTILSLLLLTFGVSIISLILVLNQQLEDTLNKNVRGIDMVVGAKGSPLQLILASVYHIDAPTGNIPLKEAESLKNNPLVAKTIPMAYGDNYKGYRILGTDTSYVSHYGGKLNSGKYWVNEFEVVAGASVARQLGLKPGNKFLGAHGLTDSNDIHEDKEYTIVGILEPSNSVLDQLLLTSVSSVWGIHDHEEEENSDTHNGEEEHEEEREITAMLVSFRSPMGTVLLPRMINENTSMQAALPAIEINRLFSLMGIGIDTLRSLALAIIIISGISVFISLYSSLKARKYELALMRSMGASRTKLLIMILLEGLLLAVIGFILGIAVSRIGIWILSDMVAGTYHYDLSPWIWLPSEYILLATTVFTGLLAASIPAIQAYNTDISKTLSDA